MLTNLDKKLIEQEAHRFDTKEIQRWLKPLTDCDIVSSFDELMENYNIHEFTTHWYDSSPRFSNGKISCELCDKNFKCSECQIWKDWDKSEGQLSFNNWIDVAGPGIWEQTQEEVNKDVEEIFNKEILEDDDFEIRTFYYQPPEDNYFHIFYYSRDREHFDYWFVFKKKAGAGSSSKKN